MGNQRKKRGKGDGGGEEVLPVDNREDVLDRERDAGEGETADGDVDEAHAETAKPEDVAVDVAAVTDGAPVTGDEAEASAEDGASEEAREDAAAAEEEDAEDAAAFAEAARGGDDGEAGSSEEPPPSSNAIAAAARVRKRPLDDRPAWLDNDMTVNLTGDLFPLPGRDDLDEPTRTSLPDELEAQLRARDAGVVARAHLKGLLEALIFASDAPIKSNELARTAAAAAEEVKALLNQLKEEYAERGIQLAEVAGGWVFRTSQTYAPFVRDLTKQKPVKMTRAQIETLAILAYRQPITRPEVDEIRGVDSGATLKMLLERDIIKILGKKDEPGRPLLYGTTPAFLEMFGLKSLKDLPTLREFTELNEDSRRVIERELGETMEDVVGGVEGEGAIDGAPAEHAPTLAELENDGPQPVIEDIGEAKADEEEAAAEGDAEAEHDAEDAADEEAEEEAEDGALAADAESEIEDEEAADGDSDDDFDDDDDEDDEDDDDDDEDSDEEPEPEAS